MEARPQREGRGPGWWCDKCSKLETGRNATGARYLNQRANGGIEFLNQCANDGKLRSRSFPTSNSPSAGP